MSNHFENGISIVLCTYNGTPRLNPTLSYIAALKIPSGCFIELIVVNNASTDDTAQFVKDQWDRLGAPFPLTVLNEATPGKGNAICTGYDYASYNLIVTVDDDNWLKDDYLLVAHDFYNINTQFYLLGGKGIAVFEEMEEAWVDDLLYHNAVGEQQPSPGKMSPLNHLLWGAGMVVNKHFWDSLRKAGFNFISRQAGKAMGEDTELSIAAILAGNERYYCDKLEFKHFMPKGRFEWNNTIKQFKGFGSTHIVFEAYKYIFSCINTAKKPSRFFWLTHFFKRMKSLREFSLKQWFFYFFMKPVGEYYVLKQHMLLSELKHTLLFYKIQADVFRHLTRWQSQFFNQWQQQQISELI